MSARRRVMEESNKSSQILTHKRREKFGLIEPSPLPQNTIVLRHRDVGMPILNPVHGDTGWVSHGRRVIYAKQFVVGSEGGHTVGASEGWYLDTDYQILKVVLTGIPDWRVPIDWEQVRLKAQIAQSSVHSIAPPPRVVRPWSSW